MIGCAQTSGWDMHQKDTPAGMDDIRCSIKRQTTGWHSQNILMRKLIGFKIEKKTIISFCMRKTISVENRFLCHCLSTGLGRNDHLRKHCEG